MQVVWPHMGTHHGLGQLDFVAIKTQCGQSLTGQSSSDSFMFIKASARDAVVQSFDGAGQGFANIVKERKPDEPIGSFAIAA
jgi:hypothetical protein